MQPRIIQDYLILCLMLVTFFFKLKSFLTCLYRVNTPRKQGGLGPMNIPLIADKTAEISKKYGCLKEDEGIAFR